MRSSPAERQGIIGDLVIATIVAFLGFGNLALPEQAQSLFGIDYLVACMGVTMLMLTLRLTLSLSRGLVWVIALLISLAALPGFFASQLSDYGLQKLQTIIIIGACLVTVGAMRRPRFGVKVYVSAGLALSLIFSALLLAVGVTEENGRTSVFGLNPIGVARLTALGMTILVVLLMATRMSLFRSALILLLTMMCGGATLVTGSRGPLIAVVGAVTIAFLATLRGRRNNLFLVFGLIAVGAATIAMGNLNPMEALGWDSGRQDSGRFDLYGSAIEQTLDNLLGLGWGGFGQLFGTTSGSFYPHNIFLEIAVEGGVFALAGFSASLLLAFYWGLNNFRHSRDASDLLILALYAFSLLNAQFSSDLVGNRMLWTSMAFIIAIRASRSKSYHTVKGLTIGARTFGAPISRGMN